MAVIVFLASLEDLLDEAWTELANIRGRISRLDAKRDKLLVELERGAEDYPFLGMSSRLGLDDLELKISNEELRKWRDKERELEERVRGKKAPDPLSRY